MLASPGTLAATLFASIPGTLAASYTTVPSPNLDLSNLGRVALAGDFDGISLYTYEGQNEDSFTTNGSQSLLSQYPDGSFYSQALSDAYIETMCPFVLKDGTLEGVVVGGNFTSLGGIQAQGIALWNPNTSAITPLTGLSGSVSSVYCDQDSSTVYVGGSFTGGNSSNAMAWTTGWTNLPFAGFNGPVTSITKSSNGSIIFGGTFNGLGNTTTPTNPDMQVINLGSGNITSGSSTSTSGFSDPSNIICKTSADDGAGNSWLLADNTAGYWEANYGFGFNPTKLRLYNTNQDGRGTKTFRFTASPENGIMNLTYIDTNGHNASCSSQCPLPENNSTHQDFHFVNVIGINGFRIDISDWYGDGGGLDGIELFQNDIYVFAISDYNEPLCDGVSTTGANSTRTGSWKETASGTSTSNYLTSVLESGTINGVSESVVFQPDITQSGNYSVMLYTPGCINDDTCSSRGIVNITGTMTKDHASISSTLYQTNNYDKYDSIYYGYVDLTDDSFRPTITLAPASGQSGPLTVVAQRVRFELQSSTGGLNGLYEYNPNEATVTTDFTSSAVDAAGMTLDSDAIINEVVVYQDTVYVAGNFSADGKSNVFAITDGTTASLPGGGLNAEVQTIYQNGSLLYMGGNFTNTAANDTAGLNGIAVFSASDNTWQTLGAGVNGPVWSIVPLQLNITGSDNETVLVISGDFSEVYGTGKNASYSASGVAGWVVSQKNWLNNIATSDLSIQGELTAFTAIPGYSSLFAGSISIGRTGLSDAVSLTGSGQPSLQPLGVSLSTIEQSSSSKSKRATTSTQNITGVATGLFYMESGLNITILGGHFTANATNGSTINNLIFVNDTNSQTITGLPSTIDADSQFLAMDTQGSQLYAGGAVTGTVDSNDINGLVVYDLATGALAATQPPALDGDSVIVNAVASQPSSSNVWVGGSFSNAGSLSCETLCRYDVSTMQWMSAGLGLSGSISSMLWSSDTELVIAGNLTISGNATYMAIYDSKSATFKEVTDASSLPGPISALSPANSAYNEFWVAGAEASGNETYFLSKYNGNNWTTVPGLGESTSIRGLQLMTLTQNHDSSALIDSDKILLITGSIDVPDYGNASAVLFNGTTFQPFVLTSSESGGQGSLARMFVQNPGNFLIESCKFYSLFVFLFCVLGLASRHVRDTEPSP